METYNRKLFVEHGITDEFVQMNHSKSIKNTLRGMHYQVAPNQEAKLIRCTRGAIYDVIVDLRPASPTYKQWVGVELSERNYRMLYVPRDFAQGYLTLQDGSEATYQVSQFYTPDSEAGIRWNDAGLGIDWPVPVNVISEKDAAWPDLNG